MLIFSLSVAYVSQHLACSVLSCSAQIPFSLSWTVSLFPSLLVLSLLLLLHSSDLHFSHWSRSDRYRRERRERQPNRFTLTFLDYLVGLFGFHCFLNTVTSYGQRWQSMGSDSEVGNGDNLIMHHRFKL